MPVYEYKCSDYKTKFEILHKSPINQDEVNCPKCNSSNNKKLFSSFNPSSNTSFASSFGECSTGQCQISAGNCSSGLCELN